MGVTGHRAGRRTLLLLLGAAALPADERQELTDWLGLLASRLAEENAEDFLRAFRKDTRALIETSVRAMIQAAEVSSTVDILAISGVEPRRELDLDWYLDLRPRAPATPNEKRRQRINLQIERVKKGWLIAGMAPMDFFGPPRNA
ncbi:MAG TPA: hypothetical protein VM120_13490 [Bryobacteraceae bacterium]|nr:hypothetical protein [Bryobacteraceae bacterium]